MAEFKELFEAYGGDYQTTMARFMQNETMYLRLLDMLFTDENMQKLGEALENNNLSAAFTAAHTLKGVVGNMGLTPLYQAVCTLLEPLRNGQQRDDYQLMYQVVRQEFQKADELRQQLKGGR